MKRWAPAVVVTLLLALGACGSDKHDSSGSTHAGAAAPGGSTKASKVEPHFAIFPGNTPGPGWTLSESTRETGAGRDAQLNGLPGVDWYTDFNGPPGTEGDPAYLSLTGYTESLAQRKGESVSDNSEVHDGDINGHPAFWFTDPNAPEDGSTVTMSITDTYSIEVYATGISMDSLLALARTVKDATEDEWKAAGGQVTDCEPTSNATACPDSADG